MPAVLVTGAATLVAPVAEALRTLGTDVTTVTELDNIAEVCATTGPGAFSSYVQLPAEYQIYGDTAVERVYHFYADGVLARFPAMAAAVPYLAEDARITFVLGQLPSDVDTQDDRDARRSLTRVLARAARADTPHGQLRVRVLDAGTPAHQVGLVALGRDPAKEELLDRLSELSYADWRVELMGLASVET